MGNLSDTTPAMKQYWSIKRQFPDCIVLFRMGDFYETFYDDAKIVARDLHIVLTSRGKGNKKAPLAGIPYHALDTYLYKLIKKGHKVAICEQLEDPRFAKGLVKRGVVRVVTPGTVIEPSYLDAKKNNYTMSIYFHSKVGETARSGVPAMTNKERFGVAVCDLSTGELYATQPSTLDMLETEIERFRPAELILPESAKELSGIAGFIERIAKDCNAKITYAEDYRFDPDNASAVIKRIINVNNLSVFDLENKPFVVGAVGALLSYLEYTQRETNIPLARMSYYRSDGMMIMDATTQRNLELTRNLSDGGSRGTLLSVIDKTVTPMGGRTIAKWLLNPLKNPKTINERLSAVDVLYEDMIRLQRLRKLLAGISDIERLTTRVMIRTATPKDLLGIKESTNIVKSLVEFVKSTGIDKDNRTDKYSVQFDMEKLSEVYSLIDDAIKEDAPAIFRDGGVIAEGYNEELDELRRIVTDTRSWLAELEKVERERTGIKTLRVRYNKIIGYFIEVPRSQAGKVPKDYIRKQTQVATERFITPLLKEKEAQALNAEERIKYLERELYSKLLDTLAGYGTMLRTVASWIGEMDVYHSFAYVSRLYNYTRPNINNGDAIIIKKGRHPVVERMVEQFISNDITLDNKEQIMIITGPNMSGKSTVLRMAALITLLAQMGSYVPAEKAEIGVVDRIFTRVGARDDITRGQSTFMTEMIETATILNNATDRSFVILDEIGRGTSTYDGMAIAWAIVEYIAKRIRCKTMFATHYHLLNLLAFKYQQVINYNITVKEYGDDVIFLHKLVKGGTDKSYGIHVAKLAGLPKEVILRSLEIASELERNDEIHREALSKFAPLGEGRAQTFATENIDAALKEFDIKLEAKLPEQLKQKTRQTTLFMFDEEDS